MNKLCMKPKHPMKAHASQLKHWIAQIDSFNVNFHLTKHFQCKVIFSLNRKSIENFSTLLKMFHVEQLHLIIATHFTWDIDRFFQIAFLSCSYNTARSNNTLNSSYSSNIAWIVHLPFHFRIKMYFQTYLFWKYYFSGNKAASRHISSPPLTATKIRRWLWNAQSRTLFFFFFYCQDLLWSRN